MRDLPKVCKHLHLPVQSGSTRVLELMRRRHTREEYLELVARIRAAIPNIQLSTDMIVGFPGETGADFEETLSLTEAVRYHSMFSFKYSERPNTLASKRMPDDVPEDGEDAADRRAASAAAVDPVGAPRASIGQTGGGAGRRDEPASRVGVVGADQRQHGGEFPGTTAVVGTFGAGVDPAGGPEQRVGRARRGAGVISLAGAHAPAEHDQAVAFSVDRAADRIRCG